MKFPKVKKKRSSAGIGLFADEDIEKDSPIAEYTGEHIDEAEKDRRGGKYIMNMNDQIYVDGKDRNNTARYINHACAPNAEAFNYDDKKIVIEAIEDIKRGEEITIDYGKEYWLDHCQPCRCASCTA